MLERPTVVAPSPAAGVAAAEEPATGAADTALLAVDVAAPLSAPWLTVASCVGIVLALGLGAALLTEIVLVVRVSLRRERQHRQDVCDEATSAITTWGHWLAGEAYALGTGMFLEREVGLAPTTPFLYVGTLSAQKQLYKMLQAPAMHGGASSHMTPSVIWSPTVLDADRETYEAFMSRQFGFPINISHIKYEASQGRAAPTCCQQRAKDHRPPSSSSSGATSRTRLSPI
jgi:hypothetical protein